VARKPRAEVPNSTYHVFSRGNNRQPIFVDDTDRLLYMRLLGSVVRIMDWSCLAYCLMSNHVHLLIETRAANLGEGMKRLQGQYTQAFNRRHHRSGHLFQGRYETRRIESDRQLAATARYIDANPVEAELCATPESWPWSSAHDLHEGTAPPWLDERRLQALLGAAVG
jgi:putative transposase